jgi:hypothetical protein
MARENDAERKKELIRMIWMTEVVQDADGGVSLKPLRPVHELSIQGAAQVIGCTAGKIKEFLREEHLTGRDNGKAAKQSYGRTIPPRIRIDASSVIEYCQGRGGSRDVHPTIR